MLRLDCRSLSTWATALTLLMVALPAGAISAPNLHPQIDLCPDDDDDDCLTALKYDAPDAEEFNGDREGGQHRDPVIVALDGAEVIIRDQGGGVATVSDRSSHSELARVVLAPRDAFHEILVMDASRNGRLDLVFTTADGSAWMLENRP